MSEEKEISEYAFLFKGNINPLALLAAQSPLAGTIITNVTYHAGMYYVAIHANERRIESYISKCKTEHNIHFEKLDIDNNNFAGYYRFVK